MLAINFTKPKNNSLFKRHRPQNNKNNEINKQSIT